MPFPSNTHGIIINFFSSFPSLWQTTYMWVDLNNRNLSPHSSDWKTKLKVQTSLAFFQHYGEICLLLHSALSGLFASSICFASPLMSAFTYMQCFLSVCLCPSFLLIKDPSCWIKVHFHDSKVMLYFCKNSK